MTFDAPNFLICTQVGFFALIGLPFSLYLAAGKQRNTILGVYTAAPIFGIFPAIWISVMSLKCGVDQGISTILLIILSSLLTIFFVKFRQNSSQFHGNKLIVVKSFGLILIIVCLTNYFNISDLTTVGIKDYFPRTNDDSFSALGMIDQIRISKTLLPRMEYPAGYFPGYFQGINIAAAVTALVAGQAELFFLDTHVAFFSTLRMTLPLVSVGIFSLILILGGGLFFATLATALFIGGNFMLHQILQQFLRSAVGAVCAVGVVSLAALAVQERFPLILVSLIGAATGIFAMASPEAHLFVVASLGLYFLASAIIISPTKSFSDSVIIVFFYFLGFTVGSLPLLPGLFIDLLPMSVALIGHPGDWCAQLGFLVQASGIGPFTYFHSQMSMSHPGVCEWLGAIFFSIATLLGFIYLFVSHMIPSPVRIKSINMSLFLGLTSIIPLAAWGILFMLGRGYAMLKVADYFTFLPVVIICFSLSQVSDLLSTVRPRFDVIFKGFCLVALSGYCLITLPNKQSIFKEYISNIEAGPKLQDYYYESKSDVNGILVDLDTFPLYLFLYVNRFRPVPLYFESNVRYILKDDKKTNLTHVFRMGHKPIADSGFIDINRPSLGCQPARSELVDANVCLKIIQSDGNGWLPASGEYPDGLYRWLSGVGEFKIFELHILDGVKLHASISPGPDLLPENHIEVVLNDQILVALESIDLPREISVRIPSTGISDTISGSVRVVGPSHGLRQIAISRLYLER